MSDGSMTRRNLLQVMTMVGAGTVAGWAGLNWAAPAVADEPPKAPEKDPALTHQWFYLIDLRDCDGCDACTKACQKMHNLSKEQEWIKVYRMTTPGGNEYFMPRTCMQCENAPCVKVCPVGASFKSPDGITLVDQSTCIGCRMCMAACPYEARYFNWGEPPQPQGSTLQKPAPEYPVPQQKGTVGKCVLCVHNLRYGKIPACVDSCSMGVLYVGDLNTGLATNGFKTIQLSEFMKHNNVVRYKEELGTRPRVYYVPGNGEGL